MVQIINPTTIVNVSGGGSGSRPSTWAEFAAMTTAQQQAVYGVGDHVGIACSLTLPSTYSDIKWMIMGWGTTKKENDTTEYPCVTLMAELTIDSGSSTYKYYFDAAEPGAAATEETAQAGIYYFGYDGSTYTALNLSEGDTIPYSDYTNVYKTDVTDNVSRFNTIRTNGWNIWKYSNLRQWLNSDGAAYHWWTASHVGDRYPEYYNQAGFLTRINQDFKAILQPVEVTTAGNGYTDDGSLFTSYDKIFLPSVYEMYLADTPVEGTRMGYYADKITSRVIKSTILQRHPYRYRTRTCADSIYRISTVEINASLNNTTCTDKNVPLALCCKIILGG